MKNINKMLNLSLVLIILGVMLLNFDKILIGVMDIVDIYGNITNIKILSTIIFFIYYIHIA